MKEKLVYCVPSDIDVVKFIDTMQSINATGFFGGYDNQELVKKAGAAGLKIYAEYGCFVGENLWNGFDSARPVTKGGAGYPKIEWYCGVNPADAETSEKVYKGLSQLVSKYDIDGVWLDFIRWPCKWEKRYPRLIDSSFDPKTINEFCRWADITYSIEAPIQYKDKWTEWKVDIINRHVKKMSLIIKDAGMTVGLFSVPWTRDDYNGVVLSIIGQDIRQLGKMVDVISPMVYHRLCQRKPEWVSEITKWCMENTDSKVMPIIQSVDRPVKMDMEEYESVISETKESDGVIIFTWDGLQGKLDETRKCFKCFK